MYRQMGRKGLESSDDVAPRLAAVVEDLLDELLANSKGCGPPALPN